MADDYNPFELGKQDQPQEPVFQEQQPYQQQPYQPQPTYVNGQLPGKGKATASLILGIIGLIVSFISPIIGLICSIIAVVMSGKAKKEGYAGSAAKAGKILGIIGIIVSVVVFAFAIAVGVAVFMSPDFQQHVQELMNS